MTHRALTVVRYTLFTLLTAVWLTSCDEKIVDTHSLYSCESFTLYADSVAERGYCAKALDNRTIASTYTFTDSALCADSVKVRFCLNGRDNEMTFYQWHTAYIVPGDTTPAMTFGSTAADSIRRSKSEIPRSMRNRWTVRLDMRPVLRALADREYYVTPLGDTIFREHFKGVWLAGEKEPLVSDIRTLRLRSDMQMFHHGDSTYLITLNLRDFAPREYAAQTFGVDSLPSRLPRFTTRQPLFDAIHNIAARRLETLVDNRKKTLSTFATAQSVILSLALASPEEAKAMLRRCVSGKRIVQDAGNGLAWPFSADRLLWIAAAHEVYKATGDSLWLAEAVEVAANTLADDHHTLLDPNYGLLHGAYSDRAGSLRSYPEWFTAADFFASMSLRVNASYYLALRAYGEMCQALGRYESLPDLQKLADDINFALWLPQRNFYSDFLYGRLFDMQSPATDNLGQALAVIAGISTAEMASTLICRTTRWHYGVAANTPVKCLTDHLSEGNIVNPATLAFWTLASAKAGNATSTVASLAAFYRNYAFTGGTGVVDASTGNPLIVLADSALYNLLSGSATMAISLRLFAGISLDEKGMHLSPCLPAAFGDYHLIEGLRYRDAVLDIEMRGTGTIIKAMTIDGKTVADATIPATLSGKHLVRVFMSGNRPAQDVATFARPLELPSAVPVRWIDRYNATLGDIDEEMQCQVVIDGVPEETLTLSTFQAPAAQGVETVAMNLYDSRLRLAGFAGPTHIIAPRQSTLIIPASKLGTPGTTILGDSPRADRYLELTPMKNLKVTVRIACKRSATAFLDILYTNGSGQEHAQTRSVIRTVMVNGQPIGTVVFPCQGEGDWFTERYSNAVKINLNKGVNTLSLEFCRPYNLNSAQSPGTALINHLRLMFLQ